MTENFVLVHGAWHGGWAWQPVASRLRAAGHRVWAPTCPGLGIDDDPRPVTLAGCVQGAFMGDADPAAAAVVHSALRPQPFRTFTAPVPGSHESMFTRPAELADALAQVAAGP